MTHPAPVRRHVVADVHGCPNPTLDDPFLLLKVLTAAAVDAGATPVGSASHKFTPTGATAVVLLAESHVSVHTWPDEGVYFLDAFTCGDIDPGVIVTDIVATLGGTTTPRVLDT